MQPILSFAIQTIASHKSLLVRQGHWDLYRAIDVVVYVIRFVVTKFQHCVQNRGEFNHKSGENLTIKVVKKHFS